MPRTIFFALVLAIGMASFADAEIVAQLDTPSQTGAPGDTLVFNVTLTNTSATDQIWLNGIGSTAASPFLSIDTDPFDVNAPLFLDPLESSSLFALIDVTIAPGTPDGPYIANFVSIQGWADGGTGIAFDDLVDVSFDVDVLSSATATPEPSSFGMLCAGALTLGLAKFRGLRRVCCRSARLDITSS
jgi:hypothetical protein